MVSVRKICSGASVCAVGLLAGACANVLGIEDTEVAAACVDGDLSYDGGDGPGAGEPKGGKGEDFSCVGSQSNPDAATETVTVTLAVVNLVNPSETIGGVKVKACGSRGDVNCANVVAEGTTNAMGMVSLEVPTKTPRGLKGYAGYFDIEGPADGNYLKYLQFFTRPLVTDRFFPLLLVSRDNFKTLFTNSDVAGDFTRGALALEAVDCPNAEVDPANEGAPNVRYAIQDACGVLDEESREFYFASGAPSTSATKTRGDLAIGGFIGVKPSNNVTVQAYWRTDGQNLKVVEDELIRAPRHAHDAAFRAEPVDRPTPGRRRGGRDTPAASHPAPWGLTGYVPTSLNPKRLQSCSTPSLVSSVNATMY